MLFGESIEDVPLDGGLIDLNLEFRLEACSVPVGQLVCPGVVFSMSVGHDWVYPSVVFMESHLQENGVVGPFTCLVIGHVVGVALVIRTDWQVRLNLRVARRKMSG